MTAPDLLDRFVAIVGARHALRDPAETGPFVTERRGLWPGATPLVLRPGSVAEVSAILKLASETGTPVVPQGGNTGLVGGQVPDMTGSEVVLSLSRLAAIREIDTASNAIVAEAGVTLHALREADSGNGIHLWDVERVQVTGNRISGHRDGIYLEFARGVILRENVSEENLRYGLHFMFSDDSFYQDNTFRRKGAGVAVMYSKNVIMTGNRFQENWGPAVYGLLLKDVQDSLVEGNLFRENSVALFVEGTDRVTFRMNQVERNGWAVRILGSAQDNHFTANNFIENTFDVTTNARRSENTFEGNYWSAYRGYDLTGDGRGDVPHRPVRLFSTMVERKPAALILLRSFFVDVLEVAERVLPVLTPETLVDPSPRMREVIP